MLPLVQEKEDIGTSILVCLVLLKKIIIINYREKTYLKEEARFSAYTIFDHYYFKTL